MQTSKSKVFSYFFLPIDGNNPIDVNNKDAIGLSYRYTGDDWWAGSPLSGEQGRHYIFCERRIEFGWWIGYNE